MNSFAEQQRDLFVHPDYSFALEAERPSADSKTKIPS
jgi:hypothetical protein